MWNIACLFKVLILAIFAMNTLDFRIIRPQSREQIYLEVLKNITSVHKILYELLGNYKNLQTIYEAQAKPQNELSREVVIHAKERQKKNRTRIDNDPEFHPVTQMILFDDVFPEESDRSEENSDSNNDDKPASKKIKQDYDIRDLTRTELRLPNEKSKTDMPKSSSNKPELIIVGTALQYSKDTPNTKDEKIDVTKRGYSSSFQENDFDENKPILRAFYNNIREEPRKLRALEDLSLHGGVRVNDIEKEHKNQTILVLVVNRIQENELRENNIYDSDSEKREEEMLSIERNMLRDAYGSVCLKVAVRKCYKTLMQVRKLICSMNYKCKHSFKENFKSKSQLACKAEFNFKGGSDIITNVTRYSHKTRHRRKAMRALDSARRHRPINYFELCLPVMTGDNKKITDNISVDEQPPRDLGKIQPINVLRNYYEKECQRLSIEKCSRACKSTVTSTCESHGRKQINSYKRTCHKECKNSFGGLIANDNDSGSDSDSDSDDDTDSDDSDDTDFDSINLDD